MIFLAGFIWLVIGGLLLWLGLQFILQTVQNPSLTQIPGQFSLSRFLARWTLDSAQAAMWIILLALSLGFLKGRVVLAKSVQRQIKRIESLPNPASLRYLYSKGYYLLIGSMILMGNIIRFLPITIDTRGALDATIGAALINGAMLFFRVCAQYGYNKKRG
jgi:hypothetical protein